MKRQILVFVVFFALGALSVFSQRKMVYLEPFKGDAAVPAQLLSDVRAQIYRAVADLGRVTLVDGHNYGCAAARVVHADYILRGVLNKASEQIKTGDREGEDYFDVDFEGEMQLVEVQTGNVLATKSIDGHGHQHIDLPGIPRHDRNYRTEARSLENKAADEAYGTAVKNCGGLVELLIDENIKIEVHITGVTNATSDEVKGVTIDRGTFSGVSEGERFIVNVTTMMGNYPTTKKIAEIRVHSQPGLHEANCKVVSGKKELKLAMDKNLRLTIVSRTAKLFD